MNSEWWQKSGFENPEETLCSEDQCLDKRLHLKSSGELNTNIAKIAKKKS